MNTQSIQGLTTLFFRNRHLLVLSIIVILVGGLSAVFSLPRLEDPRIVNRYPIIITAVPGASAERVETQVTEVLEDSLQEVAAIKDLESVSRAGVSIISIELKASVDAMTNKEIFSEIRDKISDALPLLPPEAQVPIIDDKRDPAGFTLIVAVRWTQEGAVQLGILNRLAEDLADRIRNVDGTDLVRLYGEPDEEITVIVDPAELAELGLSAVDVSRLIAAGDSKMPAGILRGARSDLLIEIQGELDSLERIAAIPLANNKNQGAVRVGDIAEVQRDWRTPPTEISLVDGERAVLIAARMNSEMRVDLWAKEVNSIIDDFTSRIGGGIVIDRIFEQERYTTNQLSELANNLLAGAVVVVGVVFFMMGWRLAFIVGLALPLVVSVVLFGLQLSGNAIHQMSIYGMIIALGLLIDNAIVIADEVTKHKGEGDSAIVAVDKAVRHLFMPLLSSTVTTILAFAPILLLPGNVGDFVSSIGGSVIMALAASFLVAMTITAGLAGIFARPSPTAARKRFWRDGVETASLAKLYRRGLRLGLRLPIAAILVACFLPASGFLAARSLGNEFFPPVDRDMFEVQVWLPTDASIDHTRRQTQAIETVIRDFEETRRVYWLIGGSFPTVFYNLVMNKDNSPHYAHAIVTAESDATAKGMIERLQRELDARFPEAQIVVGQFGQGPPVVADVEYRIYGPSLAVLQDLGERIRLVLQSHPDILHTQATMPRGKPKLWLEADEMDTRLAGLTLSDLANQLQTNLEGSLGGTVIESLEQMPVRVRYADSRRSDLRNIASMQFVQAGGDEWVPLAAIGELTLKPELGGITRFNTERTNIVKGYTKNGALPIDVTYAVLGELNAAGFKLPAGYRIGLGGALEQDSEAKGDLLIYVPILVTLTIATLVLTFRSAKLGALLGVVAGLSVGPGLLATWLIGFPISFNTILGTLGLIGLAFNNSIVVLAAIRANPEAKAGNAHTIVEQVIGTTRHILSTTLTTIGGFLPLLIIVGGDFWPSLAIVMAGGVGGSMILALVFVPAVYVLMQAESRRRGINPPAKARIRASRGVMARAMGILFLAVLFVGCAVGPDYLPPEIKTAEHFASMEAPSVQRISGEIGPAAEAAWWQALGDEPLVELINTAVRRNYDIQIVHASVREARAMRRLASSKFYPNLDVGGAYQRRRASENGQVNLGTLSDLGVARLETNFFEVGFDAAWEIDVFGGIRRSVEAAESRIEAVNDMRRDVLLSVIAEVARNYTELRGAQRRQAVVEKNIRIQSETLILVGNKYKTGLSPRIDVTRAKAQLKTTQARVPPLRAQIRAAAHRLAVLTGRQPGALLEMLLETKPIPDPPNLVPVGLPSELLRRRPDVQRAERQLAAATADIGVATADLYPRFFLTGAAGLESISFSDLFSASSRVWSLGPTIRWPIFQGGRIRANIEVVKAQRDGAYARFQQAVLVALEDVETSLVNYAEEQLEREELAGATAASTQSVALANILYEKGLEDFLTVLDAERTLTALEDRLVQSETAVVVRLIALYKALGGGWQPFEPEKVNQFVHKTT